MPTKKSRATQKTEKSPAARKRRTGSPTATKTANKDALIGGTCKSKISSTPGCVVDCAVGDVALSLQAVPNMGNVSIVGAEYPPGTAVTFTPSSINFKVQAGVHDLQVSYAFAPLTARARLVESCDKQTVWDNNVNSSLAVVPYTVCA